MLGLLLSLAIVLLWWAHTTHAMPIVTICRSCGDLVQHAPGWPAQCPNCKSLII